MSQKFHAKNNTKRKKIKKILFILIFLFACLYYLITVSKLMIPNSNEEFLRHLLEGSNPYMINSENKSFKTNVLKFLSSIDFNQPTSILKNNYLGLVSSSLDEESDETLDYLKNQSTYIKDPYPSNQIITPKVYIYNTHQLENYSASNLESYSITPNVMMASYILREKLNGLGIPSMVEVNDVTKVLQANNWNYATSYKVTRMFMESAKKENNSLEYFIDVHRDSASRNVTYKEINGTKYARIMFLIGLEHDNYQPNLALAEALNKKMEEKAKGISRGIYKKEGPGVNGIYNQDFSPKAMLIEVGGVDNTIDEVLNTLDLFSQVFAEYLGEING